MEAVDNLVRGSGSVPIMDSTPTEDSTNTVTSGGVYDFVMEQINEAITEILETSY